MKLATTLITTLLAIHIWTASAEETSNSTTLEWAPFITKETVETSTVLTIAQRVQTEFLSKQPGFIQRSLIQKNSHQFADVIYWQSPGFAQSAAQRVAKCIACTQYFELMDQEASKTLKSVFSHHAVIRHWNASPN